MTRPEILDNARKCVCGKREQDYGSPENNFSLIASLWTVYLNHPVTSEDVAMLMALLKIARIKSGTATADSFIDLAGYAACGGEIATQEKNAESDNNVVFTGSGHCVCCGVDIPEGQMVCRACVEKWKT